MYFDIIVPGLRNNREPANNQSQRHQKILVHGKCNCCWCDWSKQLMVHMLKNLEASIRDTCNVCNIQDSHMLAILRCPSNTEQSLCSPSVKTCNHSKRCDASPCPNLTPDAMKMIQKSLICSCLIKVIWTSPIIDRQGTSAVLKTFFALYKSLQTKVLTTNLGAEGQKCILHWGLNQLSTWPLISQFDCTIIATPHNKYTNLCSVACHCLDTRCSNTAHSQAVCPDSERAILGFRLNFCLNRKQASIYIIWGPGSLPLFSGR